jgi:S-formylglutathione hydrolase FrmB
MMMPGQPGTPQGVFHQFDFARQATSAIEQHQVKPFVAVFPPIMIAPPRDTECTDVPRGPQAESWLSRDVRGAVIRSLRVTPDGRRWSVMGWSTGGFCAAKLVLRHPTLFRAAVGFGAYYDAETDRTTGDLFGGNRRLRNENSPIWLIERPRPQPTRLLIIVSQLDRASYDGYAYANSKQMIEASQGTPGIATLVLPRGGHNYKVYRSTMPQALTWLGQNGGL